MAIPDRDITKIILTAEKLALLKTTVGDQFERLCARLAVDTEFREKLCQQIAQKLKEIEESRKQYVSQPTQKEQRDLRRKERQAESERAKLTQEDILTKCNSEGGCKVTINDMKNAFPKMISQIGGNAYMTQIDNKKFHEFLLSNGLTFSLPEYVFKKQA